MKDTIPKTTRDQKSNAPEDYIFTEEDLDQLEQMAEFHPSPTFRTIAFNLMEREQKRRAKDV